MRIFIPTYGRSENQVTFNNLPETIQINTRLVIQDREREKYEKIPSFNKLVLPAHIRGIGPTRQFLIDNYRTVLMLDDDLDFATRRADIPERFRASTPEDIENMLEAIVNTLDEGFHMVGVSGREGANRDTSQFKDCVRQLRIHAINCEFFREKNIRFDRVEFMEDFDATLQLLELGYPNRVLNGWVHNQHAGSNATGGCSEERTMEKQTEAAYRLQELHPKFVTVVPKYSGDWGAPRMDVRVQWKRAYESSKR